MRLDLDHVGVAVRDLDAGFARYDRLGFRLTARSLHAGATVVGGPVQPWGSGNHCAMFREGYLEVIGLTDATLPSSVKSLVARYEGLHIVAMGCDNADEAHAELTAAGAPVEGVRALERDASYGPRDEQTRRARFRNLYVDRDAFPEARLLFIEHQTRDVLWQPHLLEHPNGATRIETLWLVAQDASATALRIATLVRREATPGEKGIEIRLDRGTIAVMSPQQWRSWTREDELPPLPAPAGASIGVVDLRRTEAFLASAGVACRRIADAAGRESVFVPPREACGAALVFTQS
ncbi:MAG: VOC family protein [Betaproteobacteria bacterium]|nr:VOC family protein [Betaproteobacteria bacterium]